MALETRTLATMPSSARRVRVRDILLFLAVLAPPIAMVLIIHRYAVNVPYWDEWDNLPVVPKLYEGTLDWGSIWSQQLEHRSVTAKLVYLVLAKTTHLNLVDEMYLGFAFNFLSLVLIWNILSTSLRDDARALIAPLTIIASLLLFWPVTWEVWTWGIASFQYFSAPFWAVLTAWALTRWPGEWKAVVIGSISTVIAIYTTAHGFALIPMCILGMLSFGIRGRQFRWLQVLVFAVVALASTLVYFKGYITPTHYPPSPPPEVTPVNLARYFMTHIGAPFWTPKARLSRYFGAAGMAVMLSSAFYTMRSMRDRIRSALPWLLLISYTLATAAITTFGRLRFGIYQAASSRYSTVVILFWVSTTVIASMAIARACVRFKRATWVVPLTALALVSVTGYSYLYVKGLQMIQMRNAIFLEGLPYVLDYEHAPDANLQVFHPIARTVRDLSRKLEQYDLGPFAGRGPRTAARPVD